jgi:hypothetical protein
MATLHDRTLVPVRPRIHPRDREWLPPRMVALLDRGHRRIGADDSRVVAADAPVYATRGLAVCRRAREGTPPASRYSPRVFPPTAPPSRTVATRQAGCGSHVDATGDTVQTINAPKQPGINRVAGVCGVPPRAPSAPPRDAIRRSRCNIICPGFTPGRGCQRGGAAVRNLATTGDLTPLFDVRRWWSPWHGFGHRLRSIRGR